MHGTNIVEVKNCCFSLLFCYFSVFFLLFFGLFSVASPPWKRLNSAIFQTFLLFFGPFFVAPSPEIFLQTPLTLYTR